MNFLVTYFTPKGKKRVKTFTYNEANAIAEYAILKHYKDVSVSPLTETASIQMITFETLTGMFKDFLMNLTK